MKNFTMLLLTAGLLFAAAPSRGADWELVWSDEFDYTGLPDPKKWDYEEGFVRNQEPQYYTRGRLENARVESGLLIIEARKEQFKNPRYKPQAAGGKKPAAPEFARFTSASLITLNKASWQYGKMEIRAKLPVSLGIWPAFWAMGINRGQVGWPRCGEIDIMECWGRRTNEVTATVHFFKEGGHKSNGGKTLSKEPLAQFHTYALEWNADQMDFFYDGKKFHSVPVAKLGEGDANAFRKPFYLLLNLALEGRGKPIDEQALPQQLVVDYVRVYKAKGSP